MHFSYQKYLSGINFLKITYQVFVCDLEDYMNFLGGIFLGKSHLSYMKSCFRTNFAIISGWSVKFRLRSIRMYVYLYMYICGQLRQFWQKVHLLMI